MLRKRPWQKIRESLRLCHSAGLSVHFRQYHCAEELTTVMLEDLDRFLMEIVTGTPSTFTSEDVASWPTDQ